MAALCHMKLLCTYVATLPAEARGGVTGADHVTGVLGTLSCGSPAGAENMFILALAGGSPAIAVSLLMG
uniref:Uncharacterized protein n=1 Tax=Oryza rufipogon TaxID=4529 RepID=A0A0E0NQ58_ORYRU